jgi:hypothetical protein
MFIRLVFSFKVPPAVNAIDFNKPWIKDYIIGKDVEEAYSFNIVGAVTGTIMLRASTSTPMAI